MTERRFDGGVVVLGMDPGSSGHAAVTRFVNGQVAQISMLALAATRKSDALQIFEEAFTNPLPIRHRWFTPPAQRLSLDDKAFNLPIVRPQGAAALDELADRVPIHPLPSVVMYQRQMLADRRWL